MSRIRSFPLAAALAAVVSMAFVSGAVASPRQHVTGGSATIAPSSAAIGLLSSSNVTIIPIAPATASTTAAGAIFTLAISGGRLNPTTLRGTLLGRGGLNLVTATRTVRLRSLTLVSSRGGLAVFARVLRRHRICYSSAHPRRGCHVVGTALVLIARARPVTTSAGAITGTLDITAYTANLINRLAGKSLVTRGAVLGTITVAPTLS